MLVLPVSIGDEDPTIVAARAETLATSIPSGTHEALRLEDARRRFEEIGSAEPSTVSDRDIDQWLRLSRESVRHLARTDYAAARATLLEAQRLSDRAAEELNREQTRAQQVLDTCLYEVRSYVEQGDPRAEPRALECRRLVPRVAPTTHNHPPEVLELLARVDARLAESPPGTLRIESAPSNCVVRLNGVELGITPLVSDDLAPGEYRAQVECERGERGRVHRIRVGQGTSEVRIDTRFDQSVRSDTVLRLAYRDSSAADRHRFADTLRVGELVGAAEVWLVASEGDAVRIDRVAVRPARVLASVIAPGAASASAIDAVVSGRSVDLRGDTTRDLVRWDPARPPLAAGSDAELAIGADPAAAPDLAPEADGPSVHGGPGDVAIVGATVLGVVGVAGMVAAIVGIAGAEGCLARDSSGACVEEQRPAWGPIAAYGGLGLAALAGAVIWLVVDSEQEGGPSPVELGFAPTGVRVRGSF